MVPRRQDMFAPIAAGLPRPNEAGASAGHSFAFSRRENARAI